MEERRMDVGKRINALRLSHNLSQSQFADMLDCGQSRIAMYETGQRLPDMETIRRMADILNVQTCSILYSEQEIEEMVAAYSENNLTSIEHRLVNAFRCADERAREDAIHMLESHKEE